MQCRIFVLRYVVTHKAHPTNTPPPLFQWRTQYKELTRRNIHLKETRERGAKRNHANVFMLVCSERSLCISTRKGRYPSQPLPGRPRQAASTYTPEPFHSPLAPPLTTRPERNTPRVGFMTSRYPTSEPIQYQFSLSNAITIQSIFFMFQTSRNQSRPII